nr:YxlC family protein [Paenibacillus sp. GSMTC-2017]
MEKLDAAFEPEMPSLDEIESLVTKHKQEIRRRLWKELALFWLVAIFLLFGMMWMLESNWIWFMALQAVVGVGALWYIVASYQRKGGRTWRNN